MNMLRQQTPAGYDSVGVKWYSVTYIVWINAEDSLIITGDMTCFIKKSTQVIE
ncbi:MAG: hypothetical protein ACREH6_13095 [Geminicoccaceae bacterium]